MTFLQTPTPRKLLILAYLPPGNGGGTPGKAYANPSAKAGDGAKKGGGGEQKMVRPEGVEPPTYWFVASCSIQLSYGRTLRWMQPSKNTGIRRPEQTPAESPEENRERSGAPGRIRTSDPLVRSQMLYPTELRAQKSKVVQTLKIADNPPHGNYVVATGSGGGGITNPGTVSTISRPARRRS